MQNPRKIIQVREFWVVVYSLIRSLFTIAVLSRSLI